MATALDPASFVNRAAPGRDCGTCTLCCKVYEVPALAKPADKWCQHCKPGRGCGIHATRPDHCRAFFCLWMTGTGLPPEWKPEVAKFVLTIDPMSRWLLVQVDPGQPRAWRQEPYHSQLRRWAHDMLREERLVIVFNGRRGTVVMPDRELELGVLDAQDRIQLKARPTPAGPVYDIERTRLAA